MGQSIIITGLGHMHPEHKLSNEFFEKLNIESSAQWVEDRTGIVSRYSVLSPECLQRLRYKETDCQKLRLAGELPSLASMASAPWKMALERSTKNPTYQPELLVCGTSIPDFDIPANAAVIARELDVQSTVFDVNSACSSFVTDLAVAQGMLANQTFVNAAIFNIERYTTRVDYSDRKSAVLFGDGAICALLQTEKDSHDGGLKLVDIALHSDPSGCDLVTMPVNGYFSQIGARVQKFAITKTCQVTEEIIARNKLGVSDIAYFIGHQANLRMLQSAATKLGFRDSQHLYNVDRYGNQGAVGAPAVLSQNWQRFQKGEFIVMSVVGSGLSWGAVLLQKV